MNEFANLKDDDITIKKIAKNLSKKKDKVPIGIALEETLEILHSISPNSSKSLVLAWITDMMFENKRIYLGKKMGLESMRYAKKIDDLEERCKTLSNLASVFGKRNFHDLADNIHELAFNTVNEIEREEKRVITAIHIVEDQIEAGYEEKARIELNNIVEKALTIAEENKDIFPIALCVETGAKVEIEDIDDLFKKTIELVEKEDIKKNNDIPWIKTCLVNASIILNRINKADELTSHLKSQEEKNLQLADIIETYSNEGFFRKAGSLLRHIDNKNIRDSAIESLVENYLKRDEIDKAMDYYRDIESSFEKDLASKKIAIYYAQIEEYEKAEEFIYSIADNQLKIFSELELAEIYMKNNRIKKSRERTLQALKKGKKTDSDSIKLELVKSLIQVGFQKEAFDLSEKIDVLEEKAMAFGAIAAYHQ